MDIRPLAWVEHVIVNGCCPFVDISAVGRIRIAPTALNSLALANGLGTWESISVIGMGLRSVIIVRDYVRVDPRQRLGTFNSPGQRPGNKGIAMPQSLSRIMIHMVFSTKYRERVLTPSIRTELHPYLVGVLNNIDCPSLQVGGVEDHVHLFFGLSRTRTVAQVAETVKTSSSKWIKTKGAEFANFHWQSGYGAFSISQKHADIVINYIRNQEAHHAATEFQDEYRTILTQHNINFDERYVWD